MKPWQLSDDALHEANQEIERLKARIRQLEIDAIDDKDLPWSSGNKMTEQEWEQYQKTAQLLGQAMVRHINAMVEQFYKDANETSK